MFKCGFQKQSCENSEMHFGADILGTAVPWRRIYGHKQDEDVLLLLIVVPLMSTLRFLFRLQLKPL